MSINVLTGLTVCSWRIERCGPCPLWDYLLLRELCNYLITYAMNCSKPSRLQKRNTDVIFPYFRGFQCDIFLHGKQLAKIQKLEAKQKTKLVKALSRKETGFLEELSRGVWLGWEGASERVWNEVYSRGRGRSPWNQAMGFSICFHQEEAIGAFRTGTVQCSSCLRGQLCLSPGPFIALTLSSFLSAV